jgi:predicted transcriptional regulator
VEEAAWAAEAGNKSNTQLASFLTQRTAQLADVLSYTHISVFQQALAQTSFVETQAFVQGFGNEMWIADVETGNGTRVQQLQYAQRVSLTFQARQECLKCKGVVSETEVGCQRKCAGMDTPFAPPHPLPTSEGKAAGASKCPMGYLFKKGVSTAQEPVAAEDIDALLEPYLSVFYTKTSLPKSYRKPGTLGAVGGPLNDIPGIQQGACYACESYLKADRTNHDQPGMTCAEQPNIRWPHIQVNTLTKVSDEY